MSSFQSEALTLRTYDYSEAHKIVVFLTRRFGKVRAVAYGAKKSGSRFGSSLEPLTYLRLSFSHKENQDLAVIQNCDIIRPFPAFSITWEASLYCGYFGELLIEFSQEQEESESLFRLALAVLDAPDKTPLDLLARYLELWLLRLEGVLPALDPSLGRNLSAKVLKMMRRHPSRLLEITDFTAGEKRDLEQLTTELVEYHLEKHLKSRKMLRELLP